MNPTERISRSISVIGRATTMAALLVNLGVSGQTLVNRYSFSDANGSSNVVDSVGGPNWNGTVMQISSGFDGAPVGGLFSGSQLILQASSQQYVQLPPGILSNYTAVSIDVWATFGILPNACFLYGFGAQDTNVLSGGQASGFDYILCQPYDGRIAMSDADPGWQHEEGTGGMGNLSQLTMHVTSVYNPSAGIMELYTNGVLVSRNTGITIPMSSVSNVLSYIGRSLYNADSYGDLSLDEFRIWNGALNPLQVAGCDVNGPDNASTNYGTVTAIQLTVPSFQLVQGNHEAARVTAQASGIPNTVDISLLASYSSDKTNIIAVTNNVLYAVGQGSANITASFGGKTSTVAITVVQPASLLTHRYSFSDANGSTTVADSVGGSAWNGAVMVNGAPPTSYAGTFSGTQLSITASNSEYLQFPAGIISNYSAVTIEAWATFPTALPGNCFFFGFGNTDGGGAGEDYIYLQPSAGHIGITGADPGWQGPEDTAGTYGNLSLKTNIHITAVFNPGASWVAVFTNGVLAGKNTNTKWALSSVSSVLNYVARSLYTGDSYMDVNLDEFRIYSGALSSQGIAISDAAGPNSIPAAVTNGPGSLQSLTIQAPSSLQPLQAAPVKLLANYVGLANWDIIGNSIFPPAGLTVSVSDTNVITYANGMVQGVNAGTASIVTVYQGITNVALVTVAQAASPILAHRYSFFNEPSGSLVATDSVAGFNGTLYGGASIANGQLVIPNTSQVAPATDYLLLPNGILTNANGIGTNFNDSAVTVEAWATFGSSQGYWAALFDFGYQNASGFAAYDIHLGQLGGNTVYGIADSDDANGHNQSTTAGSLRGQTNVHIVVIFNPPAGYLACYTNGVLASTLYNETISMAGVWGTVNKIGADLWPDPGMQGSVSEFRIYNGVMAPRDIAATQAMGQAQVLSDNVNLSAAVSGATVRLSWPVSGGSFTLQSKASLTSGTWTTISTPVAQLVGSQWQVTVPKSAGANFFRLAR